MCCLVASGAGVRGARFSFAFKIRNGVRSQPLQPTPSGDLVLPGEDTHMDPFLD